MNTPDKIKLKSEWKTVRISEVIHRATININPKKCKYGYPYIGLDNITKGTFELKGIGNVEDVKSSKYQFKSEDILFGKLRPYFHKTIQSNFDGICSTDIWVLRSNDRSILDQNYFYQVTKTTDFCNLVNSTSGGTDRPRARWEVFKKKDIQIPPLSIQREIAAILSAYDDLIENNTRRIQILEEMAQRIYREWFVKFRYPGYENDRFVESELGMIPEGWEVKKLGEMITFQKGKKPKKFSDTKQEEYLPYLLIEVLKGGKSFYTNDKGMIIDELDDVIMVMDGASSGMVYIGFYGAVGSTLANIRPNDKKKLSPFILYHFFIDNLKAISDNNIGSAIPHANKDFINQMHTIIPPEKGMIDFHNYFEEIYLLIRILKEKNKNLRQTRDLLLPKLISGKIDVSELDFDIGVDA